jgi:hypothetical protein
VATQTELVGADRLRRDLKTASRKLDDLSTGHGRAGEIVAARARSLAPRRSGALASSVGSRGTPGAMEAYATAPYAGVHEYGWGARHIRAQPYLRPAAEETQSAWERAYTAELVGIVEDVRGA